MNDLLTITTVNGDGWYHLSYLAAMVAALILYAFIGIRRKYIVHHWVLILLSSMLFLTIGMHILTFSLVDWNSFLFKSGVPETKTSIGALLGLVFGSWIAQKMLKTNYPVLDVFAFILPIMAIFQRIGCLLAGCCFGFPTDSWMAIRYSSNHPIYNVHLNEGRIFPNELFSAPVHPVPLYFIFAAILTLLLLFIARTRLKQRGSLFLLFLAVISFCRCVIEEFRDVHSMNVVEVNIGKLSLIQLSTLALFFLSLILLFFREKSKLKKPQPVIQFSSSGVLILILITVVTARLFISLFQIMELMVIGLVIVVYLVSVVRLLLKRENQRFRVFASIGLVLASFVFMAQIKPLRMEEGDYSAEQSFKSELLYSINSYNFGVAIGNLKGERRRYQGSGCDRTISGYEEHQSFTGLSFHYENQKVYQSKEKILGAGIYLSPYTLTKRNASRVKIGEETKFNYLGHFYFGRDWNTFGYRVGLWFGENNYFFRDGDIFDPDDLNVIPNLRLRFGPLKKMFVTASLGDDMFFGTYRYRGKVSIGKTFNINRRPITLELGYNDRQQLSFDTYLDLSDKLALKPSITFGETPIYGIGVRYKQASYNAH